jgi:hypothetical protein
MGPCEKGPACAAGGDPAALILRTCPRFATHDEWEAWHASLSWEEQLRRSSSPLPRNVKSAATGASSCRFSHFA